MRDLRGTHFCLLAHNVINKLTAILGYCEILDVEEHESEKCIERLHKIRDLASSAAAMLQSGKCENAAVTRILELENAFAAIGDRQSPVREMPRKRREKQM